MGYNENDGLYEYGIEYDKDKYFIFRLNNKNIIDWFLNDNTFHLKDCNNKKIKLLPDQYNGYTLFDIGFSYDGYNIYINDNNWFYKEQNQRTWKKHVLYEIIFKNIFSLYYKNIKEKNSLALLYLGYIENGNNLERYYLVRKEEQLYIVILNFYDNMLINKNIIYFNNLDTIEIDGNKLYIEIKTNCLKFILNRYNFDEQELKNIISREFEKE